MIQMIFGFSHWHGSIGSEVISCLIVCFQTSYFHGERGMLMGAWYFIRRSMRMGEWEWEIFFKYSVFRQFRIFLSNFFGTISIHIPSISLLLVIVGLLVDVFHGVQATSHTNNM